MYMLMSFKTFGRVPSFWRELTFLPPAPLASRGCRAERRVPRHAARRCSPLLSSPWQGAGDPCSRSLLADESVRIAFS